MYYKIQVDDPLIDEIDIVVNAVVGDIDVNYSLEEKWPKFNNNTESTF